MQELRTYVPTFYRGSDEAERSGKNEFDDPHVPVLVRPADGIRIVLGTHDYFDIQAPDIQLERRPNGWAIFLHPVGGGDSSGYVYFLDDGRSFLVPERDLGTTPPTRLLKWDAVVSEIDKLKSHE
jgi:hypothetical protein